MNGTATADTTHVQAEHNGYRLAAQIVPVRGLSSATRIDWTESAVLAPDGSHLGEIRFSRANHVGFTNPHHAIPIARRYYAWTYDFGRMDQALATYYERPQGYSLDEIRNQALQRYIGRREARVAVVQP